KTAQKRHRTRRENPGVPGTGHRQETRRRLHRPVRHRTAVGRRPDRPTGYPASSGPGFVCLPRGRAAAAAAQLLRRGSVLTWAAGSTWILVWVGPTSGILVSGG